MSRAAAGIDLPIADGQEVGPRAGASAEFGRPHDRLDRPGPRHGTSSRKGRVALLIGSSTEVEADCNVNIEGYSAGP